MVAMSKLLNFNLEETANYFSNIERTDNEEYLLNIILQLGKEYNKLIDEHNRLVYENDALKRRLSLSRHLRQ
jgi:hypothetical protein